MENQIKPDNNMLWAILSTMFCCLPLGIMSIINAVKVDGLYMSGDYQGAQDAADKAKKYAKYGAVCGLTVLVIYFLFIIIMAYNAV